MSSLQVEKEIRRILLEKNRRKGRAIISHFADKLHFSLQQRIFRFIAYTYVKRLKSKKHSWAVSCS